MKKLALLFVCALTFISCDIDDDGPYDVHVFAEVVETDLPEFFEQGKTYKVNVTYLLPDACHSAIGVQARRAAEVGDGRREIYVVGVASHLSDLTECDEEEGDLERETSFNIRIDEDEPYTFYLWTGLDEDDKDTFTEIEVPVGEPEEEEEEV